MKTALILGSGGGIGNALVKVFAERGFHLLLHCRTKRPAIPEGAIIAGLIEGDLTEVPIRALLQHKAEELGGLDCVVNAAAIYRAKKLSFLSETEIARMVSVNLLASILVTKCLWSAVSKKEGIFVNINSLAGISGGVCESLYSATKAGMRGFSSSIQYEATADKVRVTEVFLGSAKTQMAAHKAEFDYFIEPEEIAQVILSLCCGDWKTLRIPEITISRNLYSKGA